jgi:hypothetical protein
VIIRQAPAATARSGTQRAGVRDLPLPSDPWESSRPDRTSADVGSPAKTRSASCIICHCRVVSYGQNSASQQSRSRCLYD